MLKDKSSETRAAVVASAERASSACGRSLSEDAARDNKYGRNLPGTLTKGRKPEDYSGDERVEDLRKLIFIAEGAEEMHKKTFWSPGPWKKVYGLII